MKCGRFSLGFILFWFWCINTRAQQQYEFKLQPAVKIVIDSDTIKNPWAGGLNSSVFSKIELDNDGQEDLFIFDRTQNKVSTFLARQKNGQWFWQYAPQFEYFFPMDLNGWALLRDYNADGRKDIFTKTSAGIKVYRNSTTPEGKLQFALATDFIRYNGSINLQVSSENLPSITDMDDDGDLDILTFDFSGSSRIEYYANQRVEQNLAAHDLKFIQIKDKWGLLTKCEHTCNGFLINGSCRTMGTRHNDGATLLALDLDGDADKDILIGGHNCPDLSRIINRGNLTQETLTSADISSSYPANTTRASINFFPAAYYEDVTFDNKKDLLVSPFARMNTPTHLINFRQSTWLYQNTGSNEMPNLSFQAADFLQRDMVEVGESSVPALADLDADGDLDMLVAESKGSIWYFRNVGNRTKPIFRLVQKDYLVFPEETLRDLKIQFTDLNRDSKPDLILTGRTNTTTRIHYILNTTAAGQPVNFSVNNLQILTLTVSGGDVPAFYDMDGDQDLDLVLATNNQVSATSGALHFYRNTGTFNRPVFTLENTNWGNIPIVFTRANISPVITDLNNDNNPELILGDDSEEIRVFSNFIAHQDKPFTPVAEILFNQQTNTYGTTRLGTQLALAAADVTGDRTPEIIVGTRGGGLNYFSQQMRGEVIIPDNLPEQEAIILYPNPANAYVNLVSKEMVSYRILNLAGQIIKESNQMSTAHQVSTRNFSSGLYVVQLKQKNNKITHHKLVINRK